MNHYVQDGIYYKKEKESGKIKYCNAWSFNLSEFSIDKVLMQLKQIVYITPKAKYSIDAKVAVQKGFIRKHGNENKLIIPIPYWKKEKVVI